MCQSHDKLQEHFRPQLKKALYFHFWPSGFLGDYLSHLFSLFPYFSPPLGPLPF
ncbi:hypothetical protein LguiB_024268 [Lonicera macranthoides]